MKLHEIPVVVESGHKYTNPQGVIAIKDGIKAGTVSSSPRLPKPKWLRMVTQTSPQYQWLVEQVGTHGLSTVCQEAKCPNIGECWSNGNATLMLMGSICTRACRFCAVDTGNPRGLLDKEEPAKVAQTVALMRLDYVVLTSVDRDDLPDGGASHYAQTIRAIKTACPSIKIEALTPDFQGREADIACLLDAGPDVFAQNVETVARLTHPTRDPRAGYQQTLSVLAFAKQYRPSVLTKTSLMLGLGETEAEVLETMDDLRRHQVDILTLGQYLQPTAHHPPVIEYIHPDQFATYRQLGLDKGFFEVASGPLVRSSYRADKVFKRESLD